MIESTTEETLDNLKELLKEYIILGHWYSISRTQQLSEDFIREFKDKVDWGWIYKLQELSKEFKKEFKDKVDWGLYI